MKNIQVTISGVDFNGFVFQNVFYLESDPGIHNPAEHLKATCDWVDTTLLPDMLNAMVSQCTILDISSKYVKPDSSYSIHKSVNLPGERDLNQSTGATAGVIQWVPLVGPETGRQYISGVAEGDFVNDFISSAYLTLLEPLRDAFINLTGTDAPYTWVFVVYSKGDSVVPATTDPVIVGVVVNKCGVLSKRVRA